MKRPGLRCALVVTVVAFLLGLFAGERAEARRCGTSAPRAKPHRRKAGESFPPLPLPATPLRRSERKRQPSPPVLMGKVEYGKIVWDVDENGRRYSYRDWTTDPLDMANLLRLCRARLGINYRGIHVKFETFGYNPDEVPILYLTGHEELTYPAEIRQKLRWFLNDGGYLIGDACCGAKPFTEGFLRLIRELFPRRPLHVLPPDHPIYRAYYKIDQVGYHKEGKPDWRTCVAGTERRAPYLMGVNLGCRTAVILTPFDLSCGWDGHPEPGGEGVVYDDARKLGVNMLAYCLGNYRLGRFLATKEVYHQEEDPSRDRLVFAQVVHDGDWDPTAKGVVHLLKFIESNTTLEVQFKRQAVSLDQAAALKYPMLYMTGHLDFKLSEAEVAGLRNYLRAGGFLFADACCGRKSFDRAFRREIKKALPEFDLKALPAEHPLFTTALDARQVSYSGQLAALQPNLKTPQLEAVQMGGRLAVVYSRYGVGTTWDGMERPYALTYAPGDARKIGLDIVVYAMTH